MPSGPWDFEDFIFLLLVRLLPGLKLSWVGVLKMAYQVVSYWRKYVREVLVNRLGGLSLPRKSVVRLTDRPDMILDVYCGRKTTMQQQQQQQQTLSQRCSLSLSLSSHSCLLWAKTPHTRR